MSERESRENAPAEDGRLLEEEEIRPDRAFSLVEEFRGKLIDFRSLKGFTRWVTALGIAQIIAGIILIGMNALPFPAVVIARSPQTVTVTLPVIVACLFFMALAWSWLIVGALHARWLLRIPVLATFFGIHALLLGGHDTVVTGWVILVLALLYVIWHGIAKPERYVRDMLVVGLGVSFLYVSLIDQVSLSYPTGQMLATVVALQVARLTFVLFPMLLLAGLDLGESVRDVARWAIGHGAARSGESALVWTAVAISAGKLLWMVAVGDYRWGWLGGIAFMVAAGYAIVRLKPWKGLHDEPPFGLVVVLGTSTVVLLFIALAALVLSHHAASAAAWWVDGFIGIGGAAGAWIFARRGTEAKGRTSAVFLALCSLWAFAALLEIPVLWGGRLVVGISGLDGAAAVLTLLGLLLLRSRGLATRSIAAWAISLTVGLSVIRGMVWMVQNNFDVPATAAVAQLVVMAVGMLWDVLTSGNTWTNGDSPRMPRPSRVLLYFGYVALTVTSVLYFKATGQTDTFDSDTIAMMGLMVLGIPIFLFGFARAGVLLVRQAQSRRVT